MRADVLDRRAHGRLLVRREVVEHHHVTTSQRGHEHLFDVRQERGIVDRAVEDRRRLEPVESQRRHDGVGVPMAARRVVSEADPARAAAVAAQQIGRHAAFIEKNVLAQIAERLPRAPAAALSGDVGAALFVGVDRFF